MQLYFKFYNVILRYIKNKLQKGLVKWSYKPFLLKNNYLKLNSVYNIRNKTTLIDDLFCTSRRTA